LRIIVTGSIAYDYIMSFPGVFSDHILPAKIDVLSVSFLVDSLRRESGGCAANIAYTLALLGEQPACMATVGHDFDDDLARLAGHGVDTSLIERVDGESTSSFFVSTDSTGCQIASFYVGAMGAADRLSFHDVATQDVAAAIISPNAPAAMEKYVAECQTLGIPYVYDPSQQIVRLSAEAIVEGIAGSRIFIANEYEFELIHSKTGLDVEDVKDLAGTLIITRGKSGSIVRRGNDVHTIPVALPTAEVDPTGVGDAYRAGVLFGMLHDLSWPTAGRVGALAATYSLEAVGTQNHAFSIAEFLARYAGAFGAVPNELRDALAARGGHPAIGSTVGDADVLQRSGE